MDVRNRRLDTAGRVLQCLFDDKKGTQEYECHENQLKQMKMEFGIDYRLDKQLEYLKKSGVVFYSKIGSVKYVFERLRLKKFREYFKS